LPAMRQQFGDLTGTPRWQSCEHVLQISVGVVAIYAYRLNKAHHRSGSPAGPQRSGEKLVRAPDSNRPDLVFDRVVVHRQASIVCETRQRNPSSEAVVQCFGRSRPIRDLLPGQQHLAVQGIEHRF